MKTEELTKHADWLLRAALCKCGNISDAKDLTQYVMFCMEK